MRIHISLPDELVREIDEIAGEGKRSEYIARAVREAARHDRLVRTIKAGSGMLRDADYPHWSTPEKIAEWVRESRSIPSSTERNLGYLPAGHERSDRVAEEDAGR